VKTERFQLCRINGVHGVIDHVNQRFAPLAPFAEAEKMAQRAVIWFNTGEVDPETWCWLKVKLSLETPKEVA
jgi:hypothetical protein